MMTGSLRSRQAGDTASQPSSPVHEQHASHHQAASLADASLSPAPGTDLSSNTTESAASIDAGDSTSEVSRLLSTVISLNNSSGAGLTYHQLYAAARDSVERRNSVPVVPLQQLIGSQDLAAVPTSTQSSAVTALAQNNEGIPNDGCGQDSSSNASEVGSPSISPRIFHSDHLPSPRSSPASPSSTHASSHASAKLRAVSPGSELFCINRLPPSVITRIVDILEPFNWLENLHASVPGGPHPGSFNAEPPNERRQKKKIYELLRWRHWLKRLRFNKTWYKAIAASQTWATFIAELFSYQALASFYQPSRETMLERAERVLSTRCAASFLSDYRSCHGSPLKLTETAFLGHVWLCRLHRHVVDDTSVSSPFYVCHYCLLQQGTNEMGGPIREVMGTWDKYFTFFMGNVCDKCRSTAIYEEILRVPHSWFWAVPERHRDRKLVEGVLNHSDAVTAYVNYGEGSIAETLDAVSQELWLEYQTHFRAFREEALTKLRIDKQRALEKAQARRHMKQVNVFHGMWTNSQGDIEDMIESEEEDEDEYDDGDEDGGVLFGDPRHVYLNLAAKERVADQAITFWCWNLLKNGFWIAPQTCVNMNDKGETPSLSGLPIETTSTPTSSDGGYGRYRQSHLIVLDRRGHVIPSATLVMPAFDMLTRVNKIWERVFTGVVEFGIGNLAERLKAGLGDQTSAGAAAFTNDDVLTLLRNRPLWQRPFKLRGGGTRMCGTTDFDDHVPMIPARFSDMPGQASRIFEGVWKRVRQELTACDCQICRRAKRKRQEEAKEAKEEKRKKTSRGEEEVVGVSIKG